MLCQITLFSPAAWANLETPAHLSLPQVVAPFCQGNDTPLQFCGSRCWLRLFESDAIVQAGFALAAMIMISTHCPTSGIILACREWLYITLAILEGYPACENWVVKYWRGYVSGARCKWFAYGPADATATPSSLAPVKFRMVLISGLHYVTQVVLEKRPLNRCSSSSSSSSTSYCNTLVMLVIDLSKLVLCWCVCNSVCWCSVGLICCGTGRWLSTTEITCQAQHSFHRQQQIAHRMTAFIVMLA